MYSSTGSHSLRQYRTENPALAKGSILRLSPRHPVKGNFVMICNKRVKYRVLLSGSVHGTPCYFTAVDWTARVLATHTRPLVSCTTRNEVAGFQYMHVSSSFAYTAALIAAVPPWDQVLKAATYHSLQLSPPRHTLRTGRVACECDENIYKSITFGHLTGCICRRNGGERSEGVRGVLMSGSLHSVLVYSLRDVAVFHELYTTTSKAERSEWEASLAETTKHERPHVAEGEEQIVYLEYVSGDCGGG